MSLTFLFDHHVDSKVAQGLRLRSIDVLTLAEDGSASLDDDTLMLRASQLERVVYSQDEDLLAIARHWQNSGKRFPGLVYAHQRRITIGQAVRDLELIGRVLDPADMEN